MDVTWKSQKRKKQKTKTKTKTKQKTKTQPRGVGTMRVNTAPTKLFWWLIFFRAFIFSFSNITVSKVLWNSTKFLFAVLQCVVLCLINKGGRERKRWRQKSVAPSTQGTEKLVRSGQPHGCAGTGPEHTQVGSGGPGSQVNRGGKLSLGALFFWVLLCHLNRSPAGKRAGGCSCQDAEGSGPGVPPCEVAAACECPRRRAAVGLRPRDLWVPVSLSQETEGWASDIKASPLWGRWGHPAMFKISSPLEAGAMVTWESQSWGRRSTQTHEA